jgi:hypothetical protein
MIADFTHFLRLGTHAEAETFRRASHCFDALVLNANLVEGSPAACAALAYQLGKPFLIDPYTYAFAVPHHYLLSRGKGKVSQGEPRPKRSFVGLAHAYFGENSGFVGTRSLRPEDVTPKDLTERVLDYQSSRLRRALSDPTEKYIAASPRLDPSLRIAPYFPLMDGLDWLPVNISCVTEALLIDPDVCALLAVGYDVLESQVTHLVDAIAQTGVGRVIVWVDNFDEDRAPRTALDVYSKLIHGFHDRGIVPVNLFGGFFSCIAQTKGLGGFVHGLGYGENRGIIPVLGGGQPPPRYYARPLHTNLPVLDAASIFSALSNEQYLQDVCDCVICERLINEGGVSYLFSALADTDEKGRFKPQAYALTRFHFLLSRKAEVDLFVTLDPVKRRLYLKRDERLLTDLDSKHFAKHISLWQDYL